MAPNVVWINPAGLRLDGRLATEHRRVQIELGVRDQCDGSCSYRVGSTHVVAQVYGPREVAFKNSETDRAVLQCEVAVAAFAGERRKIAQRRSKVSRTLSDAVLQMANSSVFTTQYPSSQIQIHVEVLRTDGGEMAAVLNCASLALADAGIAMRDAVVAVTIGVLDGTTVAVDLTATEARSQCPSATIAVLGHQQDMVVWCQLESRVSEETTGLMFAEAQTAARSLFHNHFKKVLTSAAFEMMRLAKDKHG